MDKLICPYCRKEQTAHEPDPADTFCNLEKCDHCGQSFWYGVTVRRNYYSYTEEYKEELKTCGQAKRLREREEFFTDK